MLVGYALSVELVSEYALSDHEATQYIVHGSKNQIDSNF